jgi:hypothetical protein
MAKAKVKDKDKDKVQRRKPAAARKETHLRVRVAESHMVEFKAAAERAGITLSAWVVERLLIAARQEAQHQKAGTTLVT